MQHRIDLIWKSQAGTKQTISKCRIEEITQFLTYAATLGITQKKVFILEVKKSTNISNFQLKKFRGVEIQVLGQQDVQSLVIILLEDSLFTTFCYLIDDIINGLLPLQSEEDAVSKVFGVIQQWKRLFEKTPMGGLTIEEQKGLYGELLIIKHLLQAGISASLVMNCWSGPDRKIHDFIFNFLAIEVKTTSANHPVIRITNEHQLSHSNILCLILIVLNENRGLTNTLPNLIDEIKTMVSECSSQYLEIFDQKLFSNRYFTTDRDQYSQTEYSIRRINAYHVSDGFPRIIPETIMEGIFDVNYQIETTACSRFQVEYPTFILEALNDESSK
jgi:hypothetical protein